MEIIPWLRQFPHRSPRRNLEALVGQGLRAVDRRPGRNVYDEEWDALVLLDACRVDALSSVADEYGFPDDVGSFRSLASTSKYWMDRTFDADRRAEMGRTAYVSGNPYTDEELDAADFRRLDEVWRDGWDDEAGTIPARRVTDAAIRAGRETDADRLIVHYMQPHFPSVPDPIGTGIDIDEFGNGEWGSVWDRMRSGALPRERAWRSYVANLRYVLDDVGLLLSNLDAERVVISADHGQAFGEWFQYGHSAARTIGVLRNVPWAVTTATDTGEYVPDPETADGDGSGTDDGSTVEDRLRDLGYV